MCNCRNCSTSISPYFYQLAAREVRGQLVLRLLCVFHVCWYIFIFICASALITCAIITSRTLLPCGL